MGKQGFLAYQLREGGLYAAGRGDHEVALVTLAANPMKKRPTRAFLIADSLRSPQLSARLQSG
jgi:hypothetical protein